MIRGALGHGFAIAATLGALACGNGNKPVTNGSGQTPPRPDAGVAEQLEPGAGYAVLAGGQYMPVSLVADGDHVYWALLGTEARDHVDGEVRRVARGGGSVQAIAVDQIAPDELTMSGENVYWANGSADTIMVWNKSGDQPAAVLSSAQRGASDLMIDEAYLYWVKGTIVRSAIVRRSLDQGSVATVHVIDEHPMVVSSDATHFYWASTQGEIWAIDKDGAAPERTIATRSAGDRALVIDIAASDTHVYWIVRGVLLDPDTIVRAPKDGGPPTVVATGRGDIGRLLIDGDTLYFSDSGTPRAAGDDGPNQGRIMRMDLDGGDPVTVAAVDEREIVGMAVVGDTVYFADSGTLDFDTGDWRSDARILSVDKGARVDVASR